MSGERVESIAVLAPVEINESMRQLLPIDKLVDRKDFFSPIFQSTDADFYSFSNNGSLLAGGADYSLDTFLSLPFSVDEVMEEGGAISFNGVEAEETGESASVKTENSDEDADGEGGNCPEEVGENGTEMDQAGRHIVKKKVYECQEPGCGTWFVRASRFHEHIMMHKNVRPFHCSVCTYKTKWKSDVKKHIKKQILKGDQTHTDGKLVVAHEYEKDKMKKYNVFHAERMIYCVDGTNKVAETGTSRDYFRDPTDPEPPPPLPVATVPVENSNGKNKKKKSGSKKLKLENNLQPEVSASQTQGTNQIQSPRIHDLPSLQNLLDLGQAQVFEPILVRQTLPIPAQEFIHLVGFNKY